MHNGRAGNSRKHLKLAHKRAAVSGTHEFYSHHLIITCQNYVTFDSQCPHQNSTSMHSIMLQSHCKKYSAFDCQINAFKRITTSTSFYIESHFFILLHDFLENQLIYLVQHQSSLVPRSALAFFYGEMFIKGPRTSIRIWQRIKYDSYSKYTIKYSMNSLVHKND